VTATAAPPVRRTPAYRAVLAAFASLGLAAGTWGARIPDIKAGLALDEGSLGTTLLGLSIGAVVGALGGGVVVRRVGSRRSVRVGWVLVGLLLVLPGQASSWAGLTAAFAALGLAVGLLDVSMNGAGVQLEHAAGVPLLSGLHAGWSAGVLAGAAAGSLAVAAGVSTAVHLTVVGGVALAAGLALGRDVPDGVIAPGGDDDGDDATGAMATGAAAAGADAAGASAAGARRIGPGPRLAALAAIGGCVFLAEGALLDWSGVLVRESLDGPEVMGALAVTGVSAGGLVGRLLGDGLAARWGSVVLLRRGAAMATVALVAALLVRPPGLVPPLLFLVGAGLAPAVPLAFATAGRLRGEHGIAVATTVGYGAYLVGPALIGGIAQATTLHLALVVPVVLVAATGALAWSTAPDQRARGARSAGDGDPF